MISHNLHTTAAYDLPSLATHNENRVCSHCSKTTVHSVGIYVDDSETERVVYHKETEFAHCHECGNTGTIILKKEHRIKEA